MPNPDERRDVMEVVRDLQILFCFKTGSVTFLKAYQAIRQPRVAARKDLGRFLLMAKDAKDVMQAGGAKITGYSVLGWKPSVSTRRTA
jgi:hypothetical protein